MYNVYGGLIKRANVYRRKKIIVVFRVAGNDSSSIEGVYKSRLEMYQDYGGEYGFEQDEVNSIAKLERIYRQLRDGKKLKDIK